MGTHINFFDENEVGFTKKVKKVEFGFWSLSPKYQTISDGSTKRELEPLLFSLLTYFIKNSDRIISRQELVDEVWRQAYVDDNAINRAISELRKVLKSDRQKAQVIKTHYRKGYSFALELDVQYYESKRPDSLDSPDNSIKLQPNTFEREVNNEQPSSKNINRYLLLSVSCFILLAAFFIYFFIYDSEKNSPFVETMSSQNTLLSWKKGTSLTPKLSKNNEFLAYSFKESDNVGFDLHIKQMNSLKEFKIVENESNVYPIGWSGIGELYYQILSSENEFKCEVWKVQVSNTNVINRNHEKMFDCESQQLISAEATKDGAVLLYTKFNYRDHSNLSAIVSRDLDTGVEYQVSSPNVSLYGDYYLRLSNKEDKVVFLRSHQSGTRVFLANVDGSDQRELFKVNYYLGSISFNNSDDALSWIDPNESQLLSYNIKSENLTKYSFESEHNFFNTFGLQIINENRIIAATDYKDSNILEYKNLEYGQTISDFSNTDMYETLVAPFNTKDGGIYLVGKNKKSLWSYANQNRKKLKDFDFFDITSIASSPKDKQLAVTRKNHLYIYSLNPLKLKSTTQLQGTVRSASWYSESKLLLTYADESVLNPWFYDITKESIVKISNDTIISALVRNNKSAIYLNDKNEIKELNLKNGENKLIFKVNEPVISWTADKNHIFFTTDRKWIVRKNINDNSPPEKIKNIKNKDILMLAKSQSSEVNALFLTVAEDKDNLLLDINFSKTKINKE